ncbi:MAG: hypothetical protein VW394_02975 [Candidatus Heimdallarchaeota archaeon]
MRLKLIFVIIVLLGGINVTSGDYPNDMDYSYDWFSFWCGHSKLNVEFNDGDLIANYEISINEENPGLCVGVPFEENFNIVIDNFYNNISDLFFSNVDVDQIEMWNTTYAQSDMAICDGGGYSKKLKLYFENLILELEDLVDNDSCFGGHTIKSHNDILTQFEFIHDKVINGINNTLNETSDSSLFEMDTSILFWNVPIALIISYVFLKKKYLLFK